jgi:hypothetical protein
MASTGLHDLLCIMNECKRVSFNEKVRERILIESFWCAIIGIICISRDVNCEDSAV